MAAQFCNDMVYGKLNILWTTGVVRLDTSVAATAYEKKAFDAWPAESEKLDSATHRYQPWNNAYPRVFEDGEYEWDY